MNFLYKAIGISVFVFLPFLADAANLNLVMLKSSVNVGDSVQIKIAVSSSDQAINALSGKIKFDSSLLAISSISTTGSIIKFWASDPAFSNDSGSVNFEGVIFNPGYQGAGGLVATISAKAIREGNASFKFDSGSVLANDGLGTDVTDKLNGTMITVTEAKKITVPAETVEQTQTIVPGLKINSSTHPDENISYPSMTAIFSWTNDINAEAVKLGYGKIAGGLPMIEYSPAISDKEITVKEDGVYYFHAQQMVGGEWGSVSHRKFVVDSTISPPIVTATSIATATMTEITVPVMEQTQEPSSYELMVLLLLSLGHLISDSPTTAALFILVLLLVARIFRTQKRISSKADEADKALDRAFGVLRTDVKQQLKLIREVKRERALTEVEKKISRNLQESLYITRKYVRKEIDDIKKAAK